MENNQDIRERLSLSSDEMMALNFINSSGPYAFRKFYRSGLRSHIFEVLLREDLNKEISGEIIDGVRCFPRAEPKKIFRIFRDRFKTTDKVFYEIHKYELLLKYLGHDLIAQSEEFMVDYKINGQKHILLCGLQEYVHGEILDPWKIFGSSYLDSFYTNTAHQKREAPSYVDKAVENIGLFVKRIKDLYTKTGYIPDLAGIGNLMLTSDGCLKLVDINNILKLELNDSIPIDDKGYPSCDISVEVLSILEDKILGRSDYMEEPLYEFILNPARRAKIKAHEKAFYQGLG